MHLGCCREGRRCALCAPPAPRPTPELVEALIVDARQRGGGSEPVVWFFGGEAPDDALLEAAAGLPIRVRVRPDLLTRDTARRLARAGVERVELDALTFHGPALKEVRRRHPAALIDTITAGLRELGIELGLVLAPGLPATSFDTCLADARRAIGIATTVRLHPVLVLADSDLREQHLDGTYTPLELGQAVTVCRAMLDVLEGGGVEVVRIGQQAGPDQLGRVTAGPHHPSLRELVEARRVADHLRIRLGGCRGAARVVIRCAPADETRTRGPFNTTVRTLRAELGLKELKIVADPELQRGHWIVQELTETS